MHVCVRVCECVRVRAATEHMLCVYVTTMHRDIFLSVTHIIHGGNNSVQAPNPSTL